VLVALSDTHGETDTDGYKPVNNFDPPWGRISSRSYSRQYDPRLADYLREAIVSADCVCHAGDFTTAAVLDAFEGLANRLVAVYENSDSAASERVGDIPVVNPGSHADPRGSHPAYAAFEDDSGGVMGRLCTPDGESFATVRV
jgi:3',5'-cyclic AMP phosphodiesterase CpdA